MASHSTARILWLRLRNQLKFMVAVATLAMLVAAICWRYDWLDAAGSERGAYDKGLTTFTKRDKSEHVVVVGIDQASVAAIRANKSYALNFGSYPWSRALWARVLEQLHAMGARAVVFDAVMDEPSSDPAGDLALAETLRTTGLPFYLGVSADAVEPPRPLPRVEPQNVPPPALAARPDPAAPPPAPAPATPAVSSPGTTEPAAGAPLDGGAATAATPGGARPGDAAAASPPGASPTAADASDDAFAAAFGDDAPADAAAPPAHTDAADEAYGPPDPQAAARALAFPVRLSEGRTLPVLDFEVAPGKKLPRHPTPPISPLLDVTAGFGLVETEADPDAQIRRTRFAYTDGVNSYVTLPVAAAADLLGAREVRLESTRLHLGAHSFPLNPDGSAEIDYGGKLEERFEVVPLVSVLDAWTLTREGRPTGLRADLFRGKVVVIGGLAVGLGDIKANPFAPDAPGVSKQAAVLDGFLTGRFIAEAHMAWSLLLTFLVAFFSVGLLTVLRSTTLEIAWPIALFFGFFLVTGLLLKLTDVHVLSAMPMLAGEVAAVTATAFNHFFAGRRAEFMREAFSQFMEREVVEDMIARNELPRLEGDLFEVTGFFSDIRGFSTFSERFRDDPRRLVALLNRYLTRVSRTLLDHGACLDKYIGDAVVCLFGAPVRHPDHALRACRAALAVRDEVERLRREFAAEGLPDVYTRIGVNTDVNFVGNFGSEQLFDYTAIGDGMNVAARLEGANKHFGSTILIGPRTYELAKDGIEARELGAVQVAGKTQALTVYELLALRGGLTPEQEAARARYARGLALYREARFAEAAQLLESGGSLEAGAEGGGEGAAVDPPARALAARCRALAQHPPPLPFDGVLSLDK